MQEIINIRNDDIKPTLSYSKFFWASEYFSFQRPGFFTSVRMFSTRNANTEQAYSLEGITHHHRGDGMNYISVAGTEYDQLAPVYDWQKLPGTTVLQKPALPEVDEIQKAGVMDFVGAVSDGRYGAVGYDFISAHDPIRARKSWFFFDDEYVCLGADIWYKYRRDGSWRLPYPLVTTMNQCHLRGDVIVNAGGTEQIPTQGERQLDEVRWVYHDRVGYIFPQAAKINLFNQTAKGSWFLVDQKNSTSKAEISTDIFKLWIDHGQRAEGLTYQYIVMPGASKEQIAEAWQNPKVEILSNTEAMQAVWHKRLNMGQIVCYKNSTLQLPNGFQIVMDSPGIYMLKFENQGVEVSVADPARKLGKMHFSVNRKFERSGEGFIAVWNEAKGVSTISIDLPQSPYAGKSVTIKL
jgi:chondroitin AC lyase